MGAVASSRHASHIAEMTVGVVMGSRVWVEKYCEGTASMICSEIKRGYKREKGIGSENWLHFIHGKKGCFMVNHPVLQKLWQK